MLNGDTYLAVDYEALLRHHQQAGALATLSLAQAADAGRYGTVVLDDAGDYLTGFREKEARASTTRHAGSMRVPTSSNAACLLGATGYRGVSQRDVLPGVLAHGHRIAARKCTEAFYDIGTPPDLAKFVAHYKEVKNGRKNWRWLKKDAGRKPAGQCPTGDRAGRHLAPDRRPLHSGPVQPRHDLPVRQRRQRRRRRARRG